MRDYYEILGIEKNASEDDIKRAYRLIAKKCHPDLNPDNKEAEQEFKEATAAYEILGDPEKRSRYDRFGHAGVDPNAQSQGFGGFGDIFDDLFDIFGGGSSSARRRGPVQGQDLRYGLNIDLKDAVFGTEETINIRRQETCSTCNGDGAKPGTDKKTCTRCNGSGEVRFAQQTPFGQVVRSASCDTCDGTGSIFEEKCETCGGLGKEYKNREIKINIPAGVDNDSVISMRGQGEAGDRGGPPGDLYIYISVEEDPIFKRERNNIFVEIPISFPEAVLGAQIEVPTLEGIEKFDLPKGTQTGTQFRLKNKGVPNLRGSGKGDLYFTVVVQVPKTVNEKQEELLLEFSKGMGEELHKHKKGFFDKVKDVFK